MSIRLRLFIVFGVIFFFPLSTSFAYHQSNNISGTSFTYNDSSVWIYAYDVTGHFWSHGYNPSSPPSDSHIVGNDWYVDTGFRPNKSFVFFIDIDGNGNFGDFIAMSLTDVVASTTMYKTYFYVETNSSGDYICANEGSISSCTTPSTPIPPKSYSLKQLSTSTCTSPDASTSICSYAYTEVSDNLSNELNAMRATLEIIFLFGLWITGFLLTFFVIKWLINPRYDNY
jgi:hypothetical protein